MSVNGNGNVAALCEALELCKHELCEMCRRHNPGETCVNGCETIIRAKTALAANHQPKPDPNWKDICAKCCDGDIEPDCAYYGEPNGCNSPIYGEHPQSAPVGDAVAMRDALVEISKFADDWQSYANTKAGALDRIYELAKAALAKPPRNCDRFDGDYKMLHTEWSEWTASPSGRNPNNTIRMTFSEWLLAPATQKGEDDGSK